MATTKTPAKNAVVSFVESSVGSVQASLGEHDEPGLYMLMTHQGCYHGNQWATTDGAKFPVIKMAGYTDAALTELLMRLFSAYNAVFVCVEAGQEYYDQLMAAWKQDLAFLGGSLPPGKPNSRKWGIQRSNGLTYGSFASTVRSNLGIRRVWHLIVTAFGRISPFNGTSAAQLSAPVPTSMDGILFTDDGHNYQTLKRHRDVYKDEPGQLQALAVVHSGKQAPPKEAPPYDKTEKAT
jgi:hypothetical protein